MRSDFQMFSVSFLFETSNDFWAVRSIHSFNFERMICCWVSCQVFHLKWKRITYLINTSLWLDIKLKSDQAGLCRWWYWSVTNISAISNGADGDLSIEWLLYRLRLTQIDWTINGFVYLISLPFSLLFDTSYSLPFYLNFLVAPLIDRSAFFACFETDDSSGYSAVSQHSKNIQFHSFGSAGLHLHFSLVDCCRYHSLGKLLSFSLSSIVHFNRCIYIVGPFSSIFSLTVVLLLTWCIS